VALTNVWLVNLAVAIVTMKTIVHPVPPDLLDQLVPTENTVRMVPKVPPVQSAVAKDTNITINRPVVKNAPMDRKETKDPLDLPDLLVPKVNLAERPEMVNPADPAQLAQLAVQAPQEEMANQDLKADQAQTQILEAKVHPVPLDRKAVPAQQAVKAMTEPPVKPVPPVLPAHQVHQAKEAKMEAKVPLVPLVHLAAPDQTPNTAHAPVVPRKHKQSHHRISPNAIFGQYGFDNDNLSIQQHHFKIIVSIMLCIHISM